MVKNMEDLLKKVSSPKDLKKMDEAQLENLSEEIRHFLLENISKTGGHLASNLGVVELTLALHYCFDFSIDKIVWDVGHQAYIHKILTGRKEAFSTLRQMDGLSGFPKPAESRYDAFSTGHSSTSISAALGMAKARDLSRQKHHVLAFIGDGSMTGGLAYEALNNAGRDGSNLIVILNDNQMSISGNVGALSKHLNHLRTGTAYRSAKENVKKFIKNVPVVGKATHDVLESIKSSAKYLLLPGVIFEEMGFQYFGPVDGHNISDMIEMFQNVKKIEGPVLIHVQTTKGKGYPFAEKKPWKYHGIGAFNIKTGEPVKKGNAPDYSAVFGEKITELAMKNEKIIGITAAMVGGTGFLPFQERFPKRFFDVGIAEQHAVTFAAGLASQGMIPVFAVYSTFLQRAYDQIVHDVCMEKLHVIFAIDRAGVVGADGETHQGVFDLSYLSHIPNMTLLAPKDKMELEEMLSFAVSYYGPIAIRYPRGTAVDSFSDHQEPIVYGKGEVLLEGKEIAILAEGSMVPFAMEAAKKLQEDGKNPMVVNMRFIKPLDKALLYQVAEQCELIVTVEDNVKQGGFGTKILEALSEKEKIGNRVVCLGFPDEYICHGTQNQLFKKYGLDGNGIYETIKGKM